MWTTPYQGNHPVHVACRDGNIRDLQLMLNSDLETFDGELIKNKVTPLMVAAFSAHSDIVELLLSQGVDTGLKTKSGATAMHYARSGDVVRLLVGRGGSVHARDESNSSPLHYAAESSLDATRALLACNAYVDVVDKSSRTPLIDAVMNSDSYQVDLGIISALLDAGADINHLDVGGKGMGPLHWAANCGDARVVKLLLDRRANIKLKGEAGRTALHYSTQAFMELELPKGQVSPFSPQACQVLLDYGANIEVHNDLGETPLFNTSNMEARLENPLPAMRFLLDRGAKQVVKGRVLLSEVSWACGISLLDWNVYTIILPRNV